MDHVADIGNMDPHAKRIGRTYPLQLLIGKLLLHKNTVLLFHSTMVKCRTDAECEDTLRQFLRFPARPGINNSRPAIFCDQVHQCPAEQLGSRAWPFRDERHPELFFRYRARNFPELLTAEEEARWRQFCRQRLLGEEQQGHMTCKQFLTLTEQLRREVPVDQVPILEAWSAHVRAVMQRLDRSVA